MYANNTNVQLINNVRKYYKCTINKQCYNTNVQLINNVRK